MDCIITAGGNPEPGEPLFSYTQGNSKAVLDMNGRTMLERVVDALQGSKYVEEVVVVGLGSDMGMQFQRPVHHLPDQGGLVSNAIAGIDWLVQNRPAATTFLASSADLPLLDANMVDAYIETCHPFDHGFYYIFVTKEVMEARFPGSNRTYVKLRDADVAGGDLIVMKFEVALANRVLWEQLSNARKHAWKIARSVGLGLMFKLLTRRLSVADIESTAARLISAPAKVIFEKHAEMAMDADKPHQVDLLRSELERLAT